MENKHWPLIDANGIDQNVKSYRERGEHHSWGSGDTQDALSIQLSRAVKTPRINDTLRLYKENADILSSTYELELIEAILNHPQNHKLRIITDGSYWSHRIFMRTDIRGKLKCWLEIHNPLDVGGVPFENASQEDFARLREMIKRSSPKEQIDLLMEHFEIVIIHIPLVRTKRELLSKISDEDSMRWVDELATAIVDCYNGNKHDEEPCDMQETLWAYYDNIDLISPHDDSVCVLHEMVESLGTCEFVFENEEPRFNRFWIEFVADKEESNMRIKVNTPSMFDSILESMVNHKAPFSNVEKMLIIRELGGCYVQVEPARDRNGVLEAIAKGHI